MYSYILIYWLIHLNRFRCSRWFLRLRSAQEHPIVSHLYVASRRSLPLSLPLTTTSLTCPRWHRAQLQPPPYTLTQRPLPSPQPLRPWSSCWVVVTAATDTPPLRMQRRTLHPHPPGETRPVARILSVCCTASLQPTSISSRLVLLTLVWHPGLRLIVPTSWAPGAWHSTPTYRNPHTF